MITKDYTTKNEKVCELFKNRLRRHPIHIDYGADAPRLVRGVRCPEFATQMHSGFVFKRYLSINIVANDEQLPPPPKMG